ACEIFHKRIALRRATPGTAPLRRARGPAGQHHPGRGPLGAVGGPQGWHRRRLHDPRSAARLRRHAVLPDSGTLEGRQGRAVTATGRYLVGVSTVAAAALFLSFVLPPHDGPTVTLALDVAIDAEGPLVCCEWRH